MAVTTPTISAVHDDELAQLLGSLGVLADLEAGRVTCRFCGTTMTMDNLQAILPDSGVVRLVCNKPDCVKRLTQFLSEK